MALCFSQNLLLFLVIFLLETTSIYGTEMTSVALVDDFNFRVGGKVSLSFIPFNIFLLKFHDVSSMPSPIPQRGEGALKAVGRTGRVFGKCSFFNAR